MCTLCRVYPTEIKRNQLAQMMLGEKTGTKHEIKQTKKIAVSNKCKIVDRNITNVKILWILKRMPENDECLYTDRAVFLFNLFTIFLCAHLSQPIRRVYIYNTILVLDINMLFSHSSSPLCFLLSLPLLFVMPNVSEFSFFPPRIHGMPSLLCIVIVAILNCVFFPSFSLVVQ